MPSSIAWRIAAIAPRRSSRSMFHVPMPITGIVAPVGPNGRARMPHPTLASGRYHPCVASLIDSLAARITLGDARPPADGKRRAAVAIVLHDEPAPRVLLMKRAERAGDPWSGHISLPGGG